jgi:hypothetical protein
MAAPAIAGTAETGAASAAGRTADASFTGLAAGVCSESTALVGADLFERAPAARSPGDRL